MKKNQDILFSIVILTYNGEKTLGRLLKKLSHVVMNYNTEIIVIDSGSHDRTVNILLKYRTLFSDYQIIEIPNKKFNHGLTRNLGVSHAKGRYVCFLSQDVDIQTSNMLEIFLDDFNLNRKVVAVFGKQIPYDSSPLIERLNILCWYKKIEQYISDNGILIQDKKNPFIPYVKEHFDIWWANSDAFGCYRRSFLQNNKFVKTQYGEDYLMGKRIIESGYVKIYDSRIFVIHSHFHQSLEHYKRLKEDFSKRGHYYSIIPHQFLCKVGIIYHLHKPVMTKIGYFLVLLFDYGIKFFFLSRVKLQQQIDILRDN